MEPTSRLKPLLVLNDVLERRYRDLAHHGERVARFAEGTAEELGLEREAAERLRLAGQLHDLGKVGVSSEVLEKPGPLTRNEWDEVRQHPEIGANLLMTSNLDHLSDWVLAHHERPDGLGYPHGRRDGEIPIESKILAVADSYDAMVTERVYRPALAPREAAHELRRCVGTQFDGGVVEAFLRSLGMSRGLVAA